jgi:ArsR family transcriptional regulator
MPEWVKDVLNATSAGAVSRSPFASDEQTLVAMPNRPGAPKCA